MKIISLGVLALLTTLSLSTSAFASGAIANNNLPIEQNKEVSVSKNQYSYTYNGITFTGLSPLKENYLHSMYDSLINHNKASIIDGPGPKCGNYSWPRIQITPFIQKICTRFHIHVLVIYIAYFLFFIFVMA
ncbi:hypothetical protein SAM19_02466 [Brevibacillus laterosporus]|nr:hypothetical protein [Brevibacillus laterosporus]